jgi:hypothetical protein
VRHPDRLRAALGVVAEADDLVDVLPVEIGEEGVECDRVPWTSEKSATRN